LESLTGDLQDEKARLENELCLTILTFSAEARMIALERDEALEAKRRLEEEEALPSASTPPDSPELTINNQAGDCLQGAPAGDAHNYMAVHVRSAEDAAHLDK